MHELDDPNVKRPRIRFERRHVVKEILKPSSFPYGILPPNFPFTVSSRPATWSQFSLQAFSCSHPLVVVQHVESQLHRQSGGDASDTRAASCGPNDESGLVSRDKHTVMTLIFFSYADRLVPSCFEFIVPCRFVVCREVCE